jgi:hypothetical protein
MALTATARPRDVAVGASLLGLAVLIRIQNGVFCAGLVAILLARRRWLHAGVAAAVLCVWAGAYGLIDLLTWGDWFHAAIAYLRANIIENRGAQWGTAEATYYARVFWTASPLIAALSLPLVALAAPRAPGMLIVLAVNVVLLSKVDHKEFRFALPAFPLWFALSGIGFTTLARGVARLRVDARWIAGAVGVGAAIAGARFHALTMGEIGQYEHERPASSAYDDFGNVNRLLLVAHDQHDLCGLMMTATHPAWAGGATTLHRHVPMYWPGDGPGANGHYNFVVSYGAAPGGRVVASEGPVALVRLGPSCTPDPGFRWWLP